MSSVGQDRLYRSIDHGLRCADDTSRVIIQTTVDAWIDVLGLNVDEPANRLLVLREYMGLADVADLLAGDGWCDNADESQALNEASNSAEVDIPAGFWWDSSGDCGMHWLYDLRGMSDDDVEAFIDSRDES